MRRALLLAILLAIQSFPVHALSCLRPEPLATYRAAEQAREPFVVLYGTLDFDADLMPPYTSDIPIDAPIPVPATFTGRGLTDAGFTHRLEASPITLRPECAGNWCGGTAPETPSLIFAEVSKQGWIVTLGACPFWLFSNPPRDVLDTIARCFAGEACPVP